jgi:hypothetical protein
MKLEMCRIMCDESATRVMKDNLADTWLPKVLQYCKKLNVEATTDLLNDMDSAIALGEISEKGEDTIHFLYLDEANNEIF